MTRGYTKFIALVMMMLGFQGYRSRFVSSNFARMDVYVCSRVCIVCCFTRGTSGSVHSFCVCLSFFWWQRATHRGYRKFTERGRMVVSDLLDRCTMSSGVFKNVCEGLRVRGIIPAMHVVPFACAAFSWRYGIVCAASSEFYACLGFFEHLCVHDVIPSCVFVCYSSTIS